MLDDALVRVMLISCRNLAKASLNPCCAGRCSSTVASGIVTNPFGVLILVVLDDALVR